MCYTLSMRNIEYTKMAYLYDKFYSKKDYRREVEFIKKFVDDKSQLILDAGCGSGNHSKILYDMGYNVQGFDKSPDMVAVANQKVPDKFFVDDLLSINCQDKFNVIISFFAVFNHLKNYREFEQAIINLKSLLLDGGKIIIDLHNPQKSGSKTETVDNATRTMTWRKCNLLKKEFTKIKYTVGKDRFVTSRSFAIFDIKKIKEIAIKTGFSSVNFYENYDTSRTASKLSKNIQVVLEI